MNDPLIVATARGLFVYEQNGHSWHETASGLAGHKVTSVIAREGVILAGTTDGIYRSDDLGQTWREVSTGLAIRHVRWLAYDPSISDSEFAGTEPAGIFVSRDGAETWQERPEVGALRDANHWFLPYSPEAGCVRGFAFHGMRVYAAVEVGGVLRSDDGGDTWRLAAGSTGNPRFGVLVSPGLIHSDVHSIAVHPTSAGLVFAPTGGGFYGSDDGGKTWTCFYSHCYCRAVWLDPMDADHLIIGPADSVDRQGRIEESYDGGHTWQLASGGLDVPWPRHMVERFTQLGENLFAVLSNGHLLVAPLAGLEWRRILPNVAGVAAVTSMQA
jgi:photosystem II stability/assembly factor-like uncharacterized protein